MSEFPMQKITIYHKNGNNWIRFIKNASFRNTAYLNHNRNGSNSSENALIRIFDVVDYGITWDAEKGDIIVNKEVDNEVTNPLTELKELYGKDNVYKITTIDKFIFDDEDIQDLNHIKLGGV